MTTAFDPGKVTFLEPSCVLFQQFNDNPEQVLITSVMGTTLEAKAQVLPALLSRERAMETYEHYLAKGYKKQPATADHSSRTQSLAHPDSVIGRLHPLGVLLPREDL